MSPPMPSPLAPEMRVILDRMRKVRRAPMYDLIPQQARELYEKAANALEPSPPSNIHKKDYTFTARDGNLVTVRLYLPHATDNLTACYGAVGNVFYEKHEKISTFQDEKILKSLSNIRKDLGCLLFFHGGGFVVGSLQTHDTLCQRLCFLAQCAVVSVQYRLAPEYPFPTAVNDAQDALLWLLKTAPSLGLDANCIAVGGDSAGGTLASGLAIWAKSQNIELKLQMLFYPGLSAYQQYNSHQQYATGYALDRQQIQYFFSHYLKESLEQPSSVNHAARTDWRFSPLDANDLPDLGGLAPVWLGVAECDVLFDENILYADKLRMARVSVDLEIFRGVTHEFIKMGRVLPQALKAQALAAQALQMAFGEEA